MTDSRSETNSDIERTLLPHEQWWKCRYEFLAKRGYRLRPRYEPNWTPSWDEPGTSRLFCEDYYSSPHRRIMDAHHLPSDTRVALKKVKKIIAIFMYSEEWRNDPRNHCVPILDSFDDEEEPDTEFIVMPLLREFDSPSFDIVEEAFDFVRQMLEATIFMHEKSVSHRDLCALNIMYDAGKVYPDGYHPAVKVYNSNAKGLARFITRAAAGGVRYFVADFGLSTRFEDDDERRVVGIFCQDNTVPELSNLKPYDPFPVDIYTLGNVFKEELVEKYTNMNAIC